MRVSFYLCYHGVACPSRMKMTSILLSQVKTGRDFAVVLKEAAMKVVGSCGIYPNDTNDIADCGWILHKDYWKRGYGTELCGELI